MPYTIEKTIKTREFLFKLNQLRKNLDKIEFNNTYNLSLFGKLNKIENEI